MIRARFILLPLLFAGCVSLPQPTSQWHGRTDGRIKVQVISSLGTLPAEGWLVESDRDVATGFVSFTKWGAGGYRYKKRAYFQVKEKWEPEAVYLGRFESRDGASEFCALNPEHGGFMEGKTFVITNSYDYCTRLIHEQA